MLLKEQIAMLEAAAAHSAERLDSILDAALLMHDYDTCDYIADNMFAKLTPAKQAALIRDGVVKPADPLH
jgi:hypothetical protein